MLWHDRDTVELRGVRAGVWNNNPLQTPPADSSTPPGRPAGGVGSEQSLRKTSSRDESDLDKRKNPGFRALAGPRRSVGVWLLWHVPELWFWLLLEGSEGLGSSSLGEGSRGGLEGFGGRLGGSASLACPTTLRSVEMWEQGSTFRGWEGVCGSGCSGAIQKLGKVL